jgi:hypothetical protein
LNIVEVFIDNSNENIHENKEGKQLERKPENNCKYSLILKTFMHNAIP